jgi:hypothetical protein
LIRFHTSHDFVYGLIPVFYVDSENNVPTYFSSLLLLFCSVALLFAGRGGESSPYMRKRWYVLSLVFLLLSMDEVAGIHELFTEPLRRAFHLSGLLYFGWVVIAVPVLIVLFLYILGFLKRLPARTARLFITSGIVYVLGSVGMEMLGGSYYAHVGVENFACTLFATLEEGLETAGAILFLYSLLDYCRTRSITPEITFR